jgi:hypothetical protein
MFNFDLSQEIEQYLLAHPVCKEYELIQTLQQQGRLPKDVLKTSLSLFRCHFLIHNALYRLQYQAVVKKRYVLDISAIEIRLTPYGTAESTNNDQESELNYFNPLSHFYLDWRHLHQTDEDDVNTLLGQFWQHYFNPTQKQNALKVLELEEPVDFNTIKKQYRRLAMTHHPDRGGDSDKLIEVHQAMQCLEQYY